MAGGGSKTASNASLFASKQNLSGGASVQPQNTEPAIASNSHSRSTDGSASTINSLAESTGGSPGKASGLKRTPTGNRGSLARWHPSEEENKRWVSLSQPEPLSEENIQKSFVKRNFLVFCKVKSRY